MPGDFTQTPVEILSDPRLRDCDRTVYAGLLSFADYGTGRNCHPSVAGVAERTARSRPAAVDAIRRLVETGWVTRHPRKTRDGDSDTTEYRFPKQRFTAEVGRHADLPRSAGLPTSVGMLTEGRSAHLPTVGQHADHDLEPSTDSHLPIADAATQAPLSLDCTEEKPARQPTIAQQRAIERKANAKRIAEAWNEAMPKHPPVLTMRGTQWDRLTFQIDAALSQPFLNRDADELVALFSVFSADPWENGEKRPRTLAQWLAPDHLATTHQKWVNDSRGQG